MYQSILRINSFLFCLQILKYKTTYRSTLSLVCKFTLIGFFSECDSVPKKDQICTKVDLFRLRGQNIASLFHVMKVSSAFNVLSKHVGYISIWLGCYVVGYNTLCVVFVNYFVPPSTRKIFLTRFWGYIRFLSKHKKSGLPDVIFHPISPHLLSNQLASNFLHRISQPLW